MTTLPGHRNNGAHFEAEGGGWVLLRRPEPALAGESPAVLLVRTAELPGNLRYLAGDNGEALLFGEVCGLTGGASLDEVKARLERLLNEPLECSMEPPEEDVEATLEASGFAWSRRDAGWAIAASDSLPRELQVRRVPPGVRVEAVLADWDEIGDGEATALAQFLVGAQAGLRFARCEQVANSARVVSRTEAGRLDTDLRHSLLGVAAGCRLLAREASALLVPEVARAYLEFRTDS